MLIVKTSTDNIKKTLIRFRYKKVTSLLVLDANSCGAKLEIFKKIYK